MTLQERLRKSQRYSVSISRHLFEQAGGDIALYLENIGVYVLKDQYYDKNTGLCLDGKGDPEEYIY